MLVKFKFNEIFDIHFLENRRFSRFLNILFRIPFKAFEFFIVQFSLLSSVKYDVQQLIE